MKLTFCGAAKQVTGSMHLLTLDSGYKILLDCGLNYEQKRELNEEAFEFLFNPADIDAVLLTHAHIDHSGNLPYLVRQGFRGNIFCTPATAELAKFLLFDSASIQWSEYKQRMARAGKTKRNRIAKPIYMDRQVEETMDKVITLPFDKKFELNEKVSFEFVEAGHLLGAAGVVVSVKKGKEIQRIGFTGDLGRKNAELIRVPLPMKNLNYLITETTYGGRKHTAVEDPEKELLKYIEETCIAHRGRLIIPAFSVGRTQAIVHVLNRLQKKGLLPDIKVFVDSPLAIRTTHVYRHHPELLNENAVAFMKEHGNLFDFDNLFWIDEMNDHDELLEYTDACVIVSAAGMVEGGRIQEHVVNNIQNPFSAILIAGYCAQGTLGHRLLQGQKTIGIKGKNYPVYSKIASTDVFSSHPDMDEIFSYITSCDNPDLKKVFLVHGEESGLVAMKKMLGESGFAKEIEIPEMGDEFRI
ncbi:MAG: MBL fold metallo-hydrolase [Bacteroidia bacterium]